MRIIKNFKEAEEVVKDKEEDKKETEKEKVSQWHNF